MGGQEDRNHTLRRGFSHPDEPAMPSNTRSLAHATNHDWDEAPYDRGTGKQQISCR